MSDLILIFPAAFGFFMFFLIAEPIFRFFLRLFGVYAIVKEGTAHVYTLFGNVVAVLEEPGLYFL